MNRTATLAHPPILTSLGAMAGRLWRGFGRAMIALAETGPRMDQIRRLNAMSDADLAARGTSREAEVRRIFADRLYL